MADGSGDELFDATADGGIVLSVHVQPGARSPGVAGRHGDALKVRLASPPTDGRANRELGRTLADVFGVRRDQVTIVAGASSRTKRVRIDGCDGPSAARRLAELLDG